MGRSGIAAACVVAIVVLSVWGGAPAQAQLEGTAFADVVLAHGINADGQSAQSDGGSTVTLCRNGSTFIGQFSFGDVIGPAQVESGIVRLTAYDGPDVDCADPGVDPLFDQDVEVRGSILLVVLTAVGEDEFGVVDAVLPPGCVESSDLGRLVAVHASAALDPVEVILDGAGVFGLSYGQLWGADLDAGAYQLAFDPLVEPFGQEIGPGSYQLALLVGGIGGDSPAVALEYGFAGPLCVAEELPTSPSSPPSAPVPEPEREADAVERPLSLTG